jgi:hypothetical protein
MSELKQEADLSSAGAKGRKSLGRSLRLRAMALGLPECEKPTGALAGPSAPMLCSSGSPRQRLARPVARTRVAPPLASCPRRRSASCATWSATACGSYGHTRPPRSHSPSARGLTRDWGDKAAAIAIYAKQAKDESLQKLVMRIRARRGRHVARSGAPSTRSTQRRLNGGTVSPARKLEHPRVSVGCPYTSPIRGHRVRRRPPGSPRFFTHAMGCDGVGNALNVNRTLEVGGSTPIGST